MDTEPNQMEKYGTFFTPIEMRWSDMDSLAHVNNAVYFSYFEEARARLFSKLNMEVFVGEYSTVLAHISCDFLKPLLYPANILVGQKLVRLGRSSMELENYLVDADDPKLIYAQARNVLVSTDSNTGKSKPWSDSFKKAIEQYFCQ